jgi:biotin carboxylase
MLSGLRIIQYAALVLQASSGILLRNLNSLGHGLVEDSRTRITLKLFEYEAKEIAQQYGVPVPKGLVASTPQEAKEAYLKLGQPSMIKAQVLVAGRGKARVKS